MYPKERLCGRSGRTPDYTHFVGPTPGIRPCITFLTFCANNATQFDHLHNEGVQAVYGNIGNSKHANSSESGPILFRSNGNQSFPRTLSTPNTCIEGAQIGFVYLNSSRQSISSMPNHGSSDFRKASPCHLMASKYKDTSKPENTFAFLFGDDLPYSSEPNPKWLLSAMKKSFSHYRRLIPLEYLYRVVLTGQAFTPPKRGQRNQLGLRRLK